MSRQNRKSQNSRNSRTSRPASDTAAHAASRAANTTPDASPASELPAPAPLQRRFLEQMRMANCSPGTVEQGGYTLQRFLARCHERAILSLAQMTPDVLAAYRRYLFHYRIERTAERWAFSTQASYYYSAGLSESRLTAPGHRAQAWSGSASVGEIGCVAASRASRWGAVKRPCA